MKAKKCPRCGGKLPPELMRDQERIQCPSCGSSFRVRRRIGGDPTIGASETPSEHATIADPEQTLADPDATIPESTIPESTIHDPDGTIADPDGTIADPEGTVADPDGTIADPGAGDTIEHTGGAFARGGASEASTLADSGSPVPTGASESGGTEITEAATEPGELPTQPVPGIMRSADDFLVGQEVGGCRILSVAGRGAMGTVFKALQIDLDRVVALKTIREEYCSDKKLLARFRQEAKTVGQFNTPSVVQVYQIGAFEKLSFLVMEFVPGGNLLDFASRETGGRLSSANAVRFLVEAADGLLEAERLGIVHRDIKPENILLDQKRRLKIADFGISKIRDASIEMTAAGNILGTPRYMSPEQCKGVKELDHRSDMYSLGATFFHLLTGKPPTSGNTVFEIIDAKLKTPALSLRKAFPEGRIPESLERIIARMTALEPDDRYPSFKDLLADLTKLRKGAPARQAPVETRAAAPSRSASGIFVAVIVLLAALGGGGYWAWQAGYLDGILPARTDGSDGTDGSDRRIPPVQTGVVEAHRSELLRLRRLLVSAGPSPELRSDVLALQSSLGADPAEPRAPLAQLLADLDDAIAREASLVALTANAAEPRVPFDALQQHVLAIRDALRAPPSASETLVECLRTRRTQTLEGLDAAAIATLGTHLAETAKRGEETLEIQEDREAFYRAVDDLARGRTRLAELFPRAETALDRAVPREALAALREQVTELMASSLPRLSASEVQERIASLRSQFATKGPEHQLETGARQLKEELPPGMEELGTELDALINDLGIGLGKAAALERFNQSPAAEVPFVELEPFLRELRSILDIPPDAGAELRAWIGAQETRYTAGKDEEFLTALLAHLEACRTARDAFEQREITAAAFEAKLAPLREGRKRLLRLFPSLAPRIEERIPDSSIEELENAIGQRNRLSSVLKEFDEAKEGDQLLDTIDSAIAWKEHGKRIQDLLAGLAQSLDAIRQVDAERDLSTQEARLARLQNDAARWKEHTDQFVAALRLLAEHRAAAASTALAALVVDGCRDPLAQPAADAATAMKRGLEDLFNSGALETAGQAFTEARSKLQVLRPLHAPSLQYPVSCLDRLQNLESLVAGKMSAIPMAMVMPTGAERPLQVGTFFIDRTEVSIEAYLPFLEECARSASVAALPGDLKLAWTGEGGQALDEAFRDAIEKLLPHLQRIANRRHPVDSLSYLQARAYLVRNHTDFPRFEEWWLAAKGDYERGVQARTYAWGDSWQRSPGVLLEIDQGEEWRTEGADTFHLSGNVAEWLRMKDSSGQQAPIAGGSYRERKREFFSGKERRTQHVNGKAGIGFRGVVRVAEFFEGLELRD